MNKFDDIEQKIYDELSQINVDASKLTEKVKSKLHEETPNVSTWRVRWRKSAVAVAAMLVIFVFTAVAAVSGGFDWFIEKFNPSFGEIVEPVEIYSEDQGIRMEIIGAQKYSNMAVVYLSLQDVTGQNRLTEQTDFRDGFSVKMNTQELKISGEKEVLTGSVSWEQNVLFFNEDTNTIYYEFIITADPETPLADPLDLGSFLIYFDTRSYIDELIPLSLAKIDSAEIMTIKEDNIWGGSNLPDDYSLFNKILKPGYYADMPHGEEDQWVSNVGIVDGKLHVQIGKIFNKEFGSSDVNLALQTSEGETIQCEYELVLLGDENNNLLNLEKNNYADAVYKYDEFIFPVIPDDFDIYFNGSVYSGVEGKWNVAVNLSDSNDKIRILKNDITIENHLLEYITLTPLGLQVMGSYEGDKCNISSMSAEVETIHGTISLEGGGGSENSEKQTFSSTWDTKTPIDVTAVTAVIINGTRIPIIN